jgi:hypothetical protein
VQSLSNTNVWAKAVVMIRENDTAGARNVATVVSPTPTNKYRRQARTSAGGTSTSDPSTANSAIASWIRLQRVGSTFTSFHSSDGVSWTQIGTNTTLGIPASALVGLGVTSHTTTANTTATAVFTNVTVEVPAPPQAPAGLNGAGQNKQVHLTWNPSAGASSYIVKMATSASGPFNNVGTGVAVTQQTVTGLTNGTPYWFKVSASNPQGSSPDSASVMSTPTLLRPTVTSVAPASGSTGASPQQAFVSCDVQLPNVGGGVDIMTATPTTVILTRASDGTVVPTHYGTSGGADVLNTTPIDDLEPNTTYNFTLTDGLKDLTGAAFMPFSSSFTTGNNDPPPPTTIAFDQSEQTNTSSRKTWTSITLGPDNRIYAATITGQIYRFNVNTDGTLVNPPTLINTVRSSNGNIDRAVIGMAWDPAATSANLILWITHGGAALTGAPDWSGKLSKLTGSSLATYQDYVVNFPRSAKDHMTNSITFKGTDPNVIYITQGSMNAMGAPDNAWSLRKEHLLSAAILKVDLTKLPGTLPLDVKTNEDDETSQPGANGRYNPFAANVAVTIFATGVRNAYDLLWHSNGELYSSTNGSASGGSCPATPSPLPSACTRRIDQPTYGSYTGPSVPGISGNTAVEDDQLYRVVAGGYYGHPNPSRCEWVMNGGNPGDAPKKPGTGYSSTVQPDRNYRGNEFNFGIHFSPNGMIEWRANVFPTLVGRIMVIRYAGGDDIITLTVDPSTKGISGTLTAIPGFGGFDDPLDIIHNPANGNVYVTEHAGQRIFLLKPRP